MSLFTYECPDHGVFYKLLYKRESTQPCNKCTNICKNVPKAGTVKVVDRLDNGLMARTVERLADIEEINEQDAQKFNQKGSSDDTES